MSGILLFRKAALDKLASPEELDGAVQLVSPARWLAVVALLALLLALVLWALVGVTHRTVPAAGTIELREGRRIAILYVPLARAVQIGRGQAAALRIPGEANLLRGRVSSIARSPASRAELAHGLVDNPGLRRLLATGQVLAVQVDLPAPAAGQASFAGYAIDATLTGEALRPIGLLFPSLGKAFGL